MILMECKKGKLKDKYSKIIIIGNSHEHQIKIPPANG